LRVKSSLGREFKSHSLVPDNPYTLFHPLMVWLLCFLDYMVAAMVEIVAENFKNKDVRCSIW